MERLSDEVMGQIVGGANSVPNNPTVNVTMLDVSDPNVSDPKQTTIIDFEQVSDRIKFGDIAPVD